MSANRKTTVAVIFGGRSVEHDVSVVTGHQIIRAFDSERYEVVPVYITPDGRWFTGDPLLELKNYPDEIISHKGVYPVVLSPSVQHHGLIINPVAGRLQKSEIKRLDVVFPAIHGTHGEDGTLQGLLELADIPYVGCAVMGSAVANDKAITKMVLRQNGIPVVNDLIFDRSEWLDDRAGVLARIKAQLRFPVFVKPVTLGSSIGVGRAQDDITLEASLDIAANFDRRIMVEEAVINAAEINCSVIGYGSRLEVSVLEQPVSWEEFLTYEEKYMRGGGGMKSAERIIPAQVSESFTARVQDYAARAFRAIDGRGISRIDFLIATQDGIITEDSPIYLNEINTLPGSLAFYLWHETGVSQSQLVEKLVKLAQDAYAEKRRTTYNYQTSLIELTASRGLKGAKSTSTATSSAASR
ncbi:MAG: D-alanine--D-alanine ligase family protein [Anaerolineae bacterium]